MKEPESPEVKRQVCKRCLLPKDIDEFQPHARSRTGRAKICKACMVAATMAGKGQARAAQTGTGVFLDLSRYPQVLEALPESAHRKIRTVEHQAIAYIVMGLKGDGFGTEADEAKG